MYAFIDKSTGVIIHSANILSKMENGYPLFPEIDTACVPSMFDVVEIDGLPFTVTPHKYLYDISSGTFTENPQYTEPDTTNTYGIPDNLYHEIKDAAIEQVQESTNGKV